MSIAIDNIFSGKNLKKALFDCNEYRFERLKTVPLHKVYAIIVNFAN